MENELNKMSQLELEELIIEMLTKQLIQEARLAGLTALVKQFSKLQFGDEVTKQLMEQFSEVVRQEIERLKTDNIVYNKIMTDKFLDGLKDVGIDLSK